jgi:pimeloyl-ACP methyl ester carboxylesterase
MNALFISGIDGGGESQWPIQATGLASPGRRLTFVDPNSLEGGPVEHAEHVLGLVNGDLNILGHSYGGITASLAAARGGSRVKSLALFEPACMTIAQDRPATKNLLSRLIPALEDAIREGASDADIAIRMFGIKGQETDPDDPNLAQVGANFRSWGPMWTHPVDPAVYARVPTLVVTGGWDVNFDEYAEVIAEHGGRHVVLPGFGHRPQDHPSANSLIESLWEQVS